ncbi:hypothetical protein BDQ12DRAFT_490780 [Crucibulum laeve]|uniref:Uncharacterized protein n=1 Tax=Crucibulum laeve TaxID=68775 RepID=A0A5C3M5U5_9AGAR|nr:hypothetical protein BDQ12DRAFT_490780 [Crucibulum laeve]
MVAHALPRHLVKRQNDPVAAPSNVAGIDGEAAATAQASATGDSLRVDSAAPTETRSAPPLAITSTPVITVAAPSTDTVTTTTPPAEESAPSSSSASSKQISMSTVIGSCVGAFVGAVALILLGLWFYKRYSQSLKKKAVRIRHPATSMSGSRNAQNDEQRRRSRLEPWNKLDDGEDKWEGMYPETKEVDTLTVAPMEKLTMFKKSPSVRTAYTHKSEEPPTFEGTHPFAQYHPNLAKELASDDSVPAAVPRPFLGRVDAGPEISWDGETVGQNSYLSIRTTRVSGGAMSPTLNMAIPTPPATASEPHRWESAEVVHYEEGQTAEVFNSNNPFHEMERRKSTNNPFFNAQVYTPSRRNSQSRSRSNSVAKSPTAKGKERAISMDPFSDDNIELPKPPAFVHHAPTGSASSASSNDRAIQSLIAALDVSEEEIQNRLRVASMQPSVISANSMYTDGGDEEDVTREFPLPPSVARKQ